MELKIIQTESLGEALAMKELLNLKGIEEVLYDFYNNYSLTQRQEHCIIQVSIQGEYSTVLFAGYLIERKSA